MTSERLLTALLGLGCGICLAGYMLHSPAAAVLGLMAMGAGAMVEVDR